MNRKTLQQLYAEHSGKVSDKWSLYLNEYDRLFKGYRDKPVRLFEIGIQNGGSLEIWSKYFDNASVFIGCDINPACGHLTFDDSRIGVIVGDANVSKVSESVFQRCSQFDIIIDDGSHLSSDIIKSFMRYFPSLVEGGLFVAEDLHCSYWSQFQGGLFDPYSSISFFKRLADIINHEHWGIPKARADILRGIFAKYGCEVEAGSLAQVHSVEFINSMCVVRKAPATNNGLGHRVIAGSLEMVVAGHLELHGTQYELAPVYDQSGNPWAARTTPPDEALPYFETQIAELDVQVATLSQSLIERDGQVATLSQLVGEYKNSTSWKLTKPVRFIWVSVKRCGKIPAFLGALLGNLNELKRVIVKFKTKSLADVERHLQLLKSEEYATQFSKDRGFSPAFLRVLVNLGTLLLRVNQSWSASYVVKICLRVAGFLRGETRAARQITSSHNRIHIDKPDRIFKVVDKSFVISGWGINIKAQSAVQMRIRIGNVLHVPHIKQREDVQLAFTTVCKLPMDVGFAAVPSLSIGFHRMWIDMQQPDGTWVPIRRAFLLCIPKIIRWPQRKSFSYQAWTRVEERQLEVEIDEIKCHIDLMIHKPKFTIIIDNRQNLAAWKETLKSIKSQIYLSYELRTLVDVGKEFDTISGQDIKPLQNLTLADASGDFIVFLENGHCLSRNALYEFSNAINQHPDIDLIYGDEDHLSGSGKRSDPFFKPDWSPDYLETFNYIGYPTCFRTLVARGCFDKARLYDFTLRFTEKTKSILHIAKVLGHKIKLQIDEETIAKICSEDTVALQDRLSRTGRQGKVREHEMYRGCYDIQLDIKDEPLVSVVIPTAGKSVNIEERQIDLILNVIDQIRNHSSYKNIEIIVVDNGDLSGCQQQILADHGCKRITYTDPIFNISKKLNLGASFANGSFLLLMNDDIEILTHSWIERLLEHFEKTHVGVVGAKLLYPDGRTQHVGVVHNSGNPDHVRRLFPRDDAGYYFSTCGVRNFMAVTGAVMMVRTEIYNKVGGYSEELAISYNDADFCLKVTELGFSVVYAPKAELTHMESQSRVASADMREVAWYQKRWAQRVISDPYYNEQCLSMASPTFEPFVNIRMV